MADKCTCEPCQFCDGKGYIYNLNGFYSIHHPMDDMAEMEDCHMCDGEGTMDCCDYCCDQHELEYLSKGKT